MADQEEAGGDLAAEESLDYLEAMDHVADQRTFRYEAHKNMDLSSIVATLTTRELMRITAITRKETLTPQQQVALAKLLLEPRANALRDDEVVALAKSGTTRVDRTIGARWRDVVEDTLAFGALPDVRLYVPTRERGAQQVVQVVPGALIALIGGTGSGKTSLALEMARCHALWTGPVAVFGLELRTVESAARLIAQHYLVGWMDAARLARADVEAALDLERAYLWGRMGLEEMAECIADVQAKHPGETVLVVIDYAQILLDEMAERLAFAAVIERVRRMLQRMLVVGIVTSQSSRAGAVALRSGEKHGKATEDTGAESAQLERAAYVTLALGEKGEDDGHGWQPADLNVGKERMGAGDAVIPLVYHGKSGRFAWAGEAEPAAKARARKSEEREVRERKASELRAEERVVAYLQVQTAPVSRRQVEEDIGGKRDLTRGAMRRLKETGVVVEVGQGARKGYHPPIMLASNSNGHATNRPRSDSTGLSTGPTVRGHSTVTSGPDPLVGGGPLVSCVSGSPDPREAGPVDEGLLAQPWEPSAVHVAYAHTHGVDLAPLVAALHAGPPVRDPDAALMAALVRAHGSPGAPQRGFLGFGGPRPRGKP